MARSISTCTVPRASSSFQCQGPGTKHPCGQFPNSAPLPHRTYPCIEVAHREQHGVEDLLGLRFKVKLLKRTNSCNCVFRTSRCQVRRSCTSHVPMPGRMRSRRSSIYFLTYMAETCGMEKFGGSYDIQLHKTRTHAISCLRIHIAFLLCMCFYIFQIFVRESKLILHAICHTYMHRFINPPLY